MSSITMAKFWLCSLLKRFRLYVPWFGTSVGKTFSIKFRFELLASTKLPLYHLRSDGKRIKKKLTTLKKKYRQTIFRLSNLITGGQTTYSIIQMRLCVSVSAGCVNENWTFNANSWLCCAVLYCTVLCCSELPSFRFCMYPSWESKIRICKKGGLYFRRWCSCRRDMSDKVVKLNVSSMYEQDPFKRGEK